MSQKPTAYWPTPRTRGLLGGSGSRQMMEAKVQNGELSKDEAEQMMGTAVRYATPQARDHRTGMDAPNAWSQLTLLPEDSHARMSQSQGNAQVSKTAPGQDSGQSFTESFASYDRDTSSWRTSQASLLTGWEEFSETWPKAGTMRSGRCYRRQMSAHRTYVNESSSPHITEFPTPAATSYGSSGNEGGGNTLSAHRPSLETMARKNKWPTPTVRQGGYIGGRIRDGKISRDTLDVAVQHTDNKEKTGGQLNPTWVEWLMGFPLGYTDLKPSATPSSHNAPNT